MHGRIKEVCRQRNIEFCENVETAALSSFRIGGVASLLLKPACVGELCDLLLLCRRHAVPFSLIAGGTNLLFDDGKIERVLISLRALDALREVPDGFVAQCGVRLSQLAAKAAACGLHGLEFACGIPGTLGGAIVMNAGAHGAEIGSVVREIEVFDPRDGRVFSMSAQEAGFAYRESVFQSEPLVVLGARLSLCADDCAAIRARMQSFLQKRRLTQPNQPSAGSTFRRPSAEVPLSRMLDELGLKGLSVGGAEVSHRHAGFIVNRGAATARDVLTLIEKIQKIVEREKGFRPIPEIRLISDRI